jgi:arginine utilization protein RocB
MGMPTVGDTRDEWFETVRRLTLRLVGIRSVSPGPGEIAVAREVLRLLQEDGLEGAFAAGLDPVAGDPHGRVNAYAYLKGETKRAVVLLGHIDTVNTADYGPLEEWALDPEALAARLDALAALAPEIAPDLAERPGDWLFGRGVVDMKSGVAANIAVMRHLARRARDGAPPPLSVILLATPDEENESAGVLQAVRFLAALRAREGLEYVGAINTDYTTPRYPGDPHRYIYTGTIGKLLPSFLIVGKESHVGDPFDGLDANLLAAELIRDLSVNAELCDVVRGQATPPPVTLHAADLKLGYDVQLPFAASFYLNVLTFTTGPGELLERLRGRAEAALRRLLGHVDAMERAWLAARGSVGASQTPASPERAGIVLSYAELRARAVARLGEDAVRDALDAEWARWPASLDKRERSLRLTHRLWTLSGERGPAIVIYYSPPYYPHIAAAPCTLHEAVAALATAHPELDLSLEEYFPFLSDMSYLRLEPGVDVAALTANMPVWHDQGAASAADAPARPGAYSLPLDGIRALDLPVVNLGVYGKGAHQRGERVLMSYSFAVLPRLIVETLERLAALAVTEA